ncbi:gliding motility protein GldB-related protein [Arundinibacter roseus]|uniref:Gliding motility protein n=1 Tax=Arundinibacter roseus TaxID=2070510 RepID=A0A4R4KL59_9BACT|nr:gliding motility protein [Arundinibacter roseus]TDB69070.1 gliding motility protein [Arundinibacter roseus]
MKTRFCNFLPIFACFVNVSPDFERMYVKPLSFFFVLLVLISLNGCSFSSEKTPDISDIALEVKVESLEDSLFGCTSEAEVRAFLNKHPFLGQVFFSNIPKNDSLLANLLYEHIRNNALQGFKKEIDSLYKNRDELIKKPLEEAFRYVTYYYPDFTPPRVATIVTGFMGNDLYISDSLIIIGLDYFGGPQATYRPDVYDYQLRRYQKEYLIPSILFFISDQFTGKDPQDATLLAQMVDYGKAFEFVKHTLPNTPDSLILGFSQRDLDKADVSQTQLWAYLIENRLLYEKAPLLKDKYIGERPFTPEIGPDVPGGIGRWIGWRIVNLYLNEQPEVTLPELMKNPNARQILEQSGYKGQLDDE